MRECEGLWWCWIKAYGGGVRGGRGGGGGEYGGEYDGGGSFLFKCRSLFLVLGSGKGSTSDLEGDSISLYGQIFRIPCARRSTLPDTIRCRLR